VETKTKEAFMEALDLIEQLKPYVQALAYGVRNSDSDVHRLLEQTSRFLGRHSS